MFPANAYKSPPSSRFGKIYQESRIETIENVVPENFATPLREYTRLGKLLTTAGKPVRGGMNEGIFVVEVRESKEKLVEKRLSVTKGSHARRTRAEIDALTRLLHAGPNPHINKIHESFYPGMTSYTCIYLSYCEGGSLLDYIFRCEKANTDVPELFAWHVLVSIMSALVFCHHGVNTSQAMQPVPQWKTLCHLDVKPDNIWLTAKDRQSGNFSGQDFPRVVLGDFGCSVTKDEISTGLAQSLMLTHGTPGWLPDEARAPLHQSAASHSGSGRKEVIHGTYGKPTDIWQAGGTIQCMCRLKCAPNAKQAAERRPCGMTKYSRALNLLVASCMETNVSLRPTSLDAYQWARKDIEKLREQEKDKQNTVTW